MKNIIGFLLAIIGVVLGAYIGLYLMFICGITEIITQIKAPELSATDTAIAIAKILLAAPVGVILTQAFIVAGVAFSRS